MYRAHSDDEASIDEELAHELSVQSHLAPEQFARCQTQMMDIEIVASPKEIEANPSLLTWKVMPHLTKTFKQNLALTGRSVAGEEHLAGNLKRMLPLGFNIISQTNTYPFGIGIEVPGMMSKNLHKSGACVWRVPANTQTMMVNTKVFDPENKVNQHMYENYRMCTMEDLEEDIKFHPKVNGKHDAYATVTKGTLAYEALAENLRNGHWRDQGLTQSQIAHILSPGDNWNVQVTEHMGQSIKELLKPQVEEVAKSFIDAENFVVKVSRQDGVAGFGTPLKIAGALTGTNTAGNDTTHKIQTDAMERAQVFNLKAELVYLLF
jgi:hypothetical protein